MLRGGNMKRLVLMIAVILLMIIDIAMLIDMIVYGIYPIYKFIILVTGIIILGIILYFSIRMKNVR